MSGNKERPWEQGQFIPTTATRRWKEWEKQEAQEREQRMVFSGGDRVAVFRTPEDARRTVACVNACAGLDTVGLEQLPRTDSPLASRLADLTAQRNDLLEVLERLTRWGEVQAVCKVSGDHPVALALAAIAKAKGGAQ